MEAALLMVDMNKAFFMYRDDDIESVAKEIMEYLQKRPLATDSLHGIAQWWLVQQAIEKNLTLVEQALAHLAQEGKVLKKDNASDATYCLNPTYKPEKNTDESNQHDSDKR